MIAAYRDILTRKCDACDQLLGKKPQLPVVRTRVRRRRDSNEEKEKDRQREELKNNGDDGGTNNEAKKGREEEGVGRREEEGYEWAAYHVDCPIPSSS